jgi:predicted Zn-dependent protease
MNESRVDTLKKLVEKNPGSALGRYGLANEYMKLGMYEEAIGEIKEYLKIKDDEGAVYRMLAEACLMLGRIDEAREAYKLGISAALKHGHPSMAEEFEEALEALK